MVGVGDALVRATSDEDALVRSRALAALAPLVDQGWPPAATAARDALDDPLRAVRVEAAWGLRRTLPADARAARDLVAFLEHNRDQPMGAHRYAMWHLARGEPALALPLLERAVEWDSHTGLFRHDLAAALSALGRAPEALELLELACIELPDDPLLEFGRGLTLGELGELPRATQAFARAVQLDPGYGRAWYNLGLVRSQLDDWRGALEALRRAESADPGSPDAAWAAATILWAQERTDEAFDAAQRVLARDPNHREARELLLRRGG